MKSFRIRLVRNFTGMILIIFVFIYLLFNMLTNNFISAEARRELTTSGIDIENIASNEPPQGLPFMRGGSGQIANILYEWQQVRSLGRLIMNTDGIIINEYGEIITANIGASAGIITPEITFLSGYFLSNRARFEDDTMVRISHADHTYYLKAIDFSLTGEISFSVLLYTDITTALTFMRNINQTLVILLIASAIIGVAISFLMSSQIQKAIVRLGKYAEVIGGGNFGTKVGNFDYKEFSELAGSMNNMSNMLSAYDNSQKQFFQNVSHELRTPLMSIQGYAEGIYEEVLIPKEASEIIMTESAKMERLVSQLLYISRMDSGLDVLDISSVNVKNVLFDSAERIKILAEKDGKEILFDFTDADCEIKTDVGKLQRAIDNILSNCIRHAKTKIVIGLRVENEQTVISISDDGDGISEDDLPNLFERFYKGKNGNSGLGLAICKDVVERLGGEIRAENICNNVDDVLSLSSESKGARFVVAIPLSANNFQG